MPQIARHNDPCGGQIIASAIKTFVNGLLVARLNDAVTPHGTGAHNNATLSTASTTVFVEGLPVCRLGDSATCGHTISSASPNVFAG